MPKYVDSKGVVRTYPGSPWLRTGPPIAYPIRWLEREDEPKDRRKDEAN